MTLTGTLLALFDAGWRSPLRWLLLVSVTLYAAALALDASGHGGAICGKTTTLDQLRMLKFQIDAGLIKPSEAARDWMLMIGAMMLPLLSQPIARIVNAVGLSARPCSVAGFLFGYLTIWSSAAVVVVPAGLLLGAASQATGWIAAAAWVLAFGWSCTPVAQRARNRMHARAVICGFGTSAIRASTVYGFRSGALCLLTCWPWMLTPFALGPLHLLVMPLITVYLILDRMEIPARPRWRWPPAIDLLLVRAMPTIALGSTRRDVRRSMTA